MRSIFLRGTRAIVMLGVLAAGLTVASAPASAATAAIETVVAGPTPTIVLQGSGLPVVPSTDVGVPAETSYVEFTDSTGLAGTWHEGYSTRGDTCPLTIGESTATTLVLRLSPCGVYAVSAGDAVAVNVYDGSGTEVASSGTTAVAATGSSAAISDVEPADGPQSGGTATKPGTGTVTLSGADLDGAEAVWLGGVATTPGTDTDGSLTFVPPASPSAQGVGVQVASLAGTSPTDCDVIQLSCADGFFYLATDQVSLPPTSLDVNLGTQISAGTLQSADNACTPNRSTSGQVGESLGIGGSISGGPVEFSGALSHASDDGVPSALVGNATVTIVSPVTAQVQLTGGLSGCAEVPVPGLTVPDGVGFYLLLGGSLTSAVSESVTIAAGTYTIDAGWVPGHELGVTSVTAQCTSGDSLAACVSASGSLSVAGSVEISPVWFQLGPSNAYFGVGATFAGAAQASNGTLTEDACYGVNWAFNVSAGPFSASAGGTFLGPDNIGQGDPTICPLGQAAAPPTPLSVTPSTLSSATSGQPYDQALTAGGGVPGYTFSSNGGLPSGLSISSSGVVSGTTTDVGTFAPVISVTDATGDTISASITLLVNPGSVTSNPLSFSTTSLGMATQGSPYSQAIVVSGGVGPYQWQATQGAPPTGLSLNSSTGVLSGTVGSGASTTTFTVQVTDHTGATVSESLQLTVSAQGASAPTISTFSATQPYYVVNGGNYTLQWTASGATSCQLTFPSALRSPTTYSPPSSACDSAKVGFGAYPATPADYQVQLCESNASGTTCTTTQVVISDVQKLAVYSADGAYTMPEGQVGTYYCWTPVVIGGTPPYAWSWSGTTTPGLSMVNTSTGKVCGTPTTVGSFSPTFHVSDTEPLTQNTSSTWTSEVLEAPLAITTTSLPDASLGAAYQATISATGGGCTTPNLTVAGLPPGLSASPSGALSGTPTQGGLFPLSVIATYCRGPIAQTSVTSTIDLSVSTPPLLVTAPSPETCVAGQTCTITPAASGGTPGYSWFVSGGTLPGGLSLDAASGTISGTANAPGNYAVIVSVTDGSSPAVETSTSLLIDVLAVPTVGLSSPAGPFDVGTQIPITATVTAPSGVTTTPSGTVTVSDGEHDCTADLSGSATASLATGTCDVAEGAPGTYGASGAYGGDGAFLDAATSSPLSLQVSQLGTTTTISPSEAQGTLGTPVALTITVRSDLAGTGAATPTGSVALSDSAHTPVSCPTGIAGTNGVATATCSLSESTAAVYAITASYGGDSTFGGSTSAATSLTIKWASSTALKVAETALTAGHEKGDKLTVTVSSARSGSVTGTVWITTGKQLVCAVALSSGSGGCTLGARTLPGGTWKLVAQFLGNAQVGPSPSTPVTVTVGKESSTSSLTIVPASTSPSGEIGVLFAVHVAPHYGDLADGIVDVEAGSTVLCTVTLKKSNAGTCSMGSAILAKGAHAITAHFVGTASVKASTSLARTLTVT